MSWTLVSLDLNFLSRGRSFPPVMVFVNRHGDTVVQARHNAVVFTSSPLVQFPQFCICTFPKPKSLQNNKTPHAVHKLCVGMRLLTYLASYPSSHEAGQKKGTVGYQPKEWSRREYQGSDRLLRMSFHITETPKTTGCFGDTSSNGWRCIYGWQIAKALIYFLDCTSSISALRKRSEELETCSGNEEPSDSPTREDDYGARKTGELSFFLQRRHHRGNEFKVW